MTDIQTVEYREHGVPEKRGFPVYRVLLAIQAVSILIVIVAAKGWINA